MDMKKSYEALNQKERAFLSYHPLAAIDFKANADAALKEAQKRFGANTLHNGSGDAFRHCLWSAMNARDQGIEVAKEFGDAHESWTGNPTAEKTMDLHNNSIGFSIGASLPPNTSNRHVAVLCVQAWANGKLVQIQGKRQTDLVYSNSKESYIYQAPSP